MKPEKKLCSIFSEQLKLKFVKGPFTRTFSVTVKFTLTGRMGSEPNLSI